MESALKRLAVGLAALCLFAPGLIGAQGTAADPRAVQPERPTVATHAGTVAPGYLEIEIGIERDQFSSSTSSFLTPTVLKFGIASHAQLSINGAFLHSNDGSGVGDVSAGIKWRLLDDAPMVGDFAILPAVKFPTGAVAKGTGTGTTDVSLLAISSHMFGPLAMDLNAGFTKRSGDGSAAPKMATVWTASFGESLNSHVGWVAELYGYPGTGGEAGAKGTVGLLTGPTFSVATQLALDLGLIVPVSGPQPHALYAGGVWNAGRLW